MTNFIIIYALINQPTNAKNSFMTNCIKQVFINQLTNAKNSFMTNCIK